MTAQLPITVTLDRVENGLAALRTAGGHTFSWPQEHLPPQCAPGDAFCLDLHAASTAKLTDDAMRAPLGMAMLNEILRAT